MAKGYSARNGFGGSAGMMRQQQQMQQKLAKRQQEMESAQKNVEESSFTASVGGGAVQATVSGKKQLTALTIQPDAVDPADVEMLQDLVISAVNEALRQAEEAMESAMGALGTSPCCFEFTREIAKKQPKGCFFAFGTTVGRHGPRPSGPLCHLR